jgi:hypothetical protein
MIPKAIKQEILLNQIGRIDVLHRLKSPLMISSVVFMKKFGPTISFFNEDLRLTRRINNKLEFPVIQVYKRGHPEVMVKVNPTQMKAEDILLDIQKINEKYSGKNETTEKV